MAEDILIKGGDVFLPDSKTFQKIDILIKNGRIAQVENKIVPSDNVKILDASSKIVTPGLIDFHMHAFRYGHLLSIDTEELAPRSGTTTFIDGGSTGSLNFLAFREYIVKPSSINIFAFLNISAIGQATDGIEGLGFHENDHDSLLHLPSAIEVIEKNREIIIGIKVRAYTGLKSTTALQKARELGDTVNLPIMVHTAPPPPAFDEILPYLREGDIITHPFHGGNGTILNNKGKIRQIYWEAKNRGIEVDLGLDRFHGDLNIMKAALEQGFIPDYISTDLAMPNLHHIVFDLPTTVSKFLAFGMPLEEILARCTFAPAKKIKKADQIGLLQKGLDADIAIFDKVFDDFTFEDYFGNVIQAKERILPYMTLSKGQILKPNQRTTDTLNCVFKGTSSWHFDKG